MADISVVAIITAKAGEGDAVQTMLSDLAAASQQEDGCVLYSLQRGVQDRDVFVTVEKWTSLDHLDKHMNGPSIAGAMASGGHLLAGAPQIVPAEVLGVGDPAKARY
ncbi:MAG TPA: putative quinol monooxygenase [Mycobacteriales bacterium]|jgi:quinol monooxygenase YgiN|nr:putative quinol monooxygenase [Mycobacteriales bacterium]